MSKIVFLSDTSVVYEGNLTKVNSNVLRIAFTSKVPAKKALITGMNIINEHNGKVMSFKEDYKTIYRTYENNKVIELSNDGSVYVEPEIVEPVPPTAEELAAMLAENKVEKINESKALLSDYLERHPLVSNCHGGVDATYTVTTDKQTLMASNYLTYKIAKESGVENPVLTWNAAGCECEPWTEEEYITLVLQVSEYVKPLVALQQSYEVQINACETQEELDTIDIVYDVYGASV